MWAGPSDRSGSVLLLQYGVMRHMGFSVILYEGQYLQLYRKGVLIPPQKEMLHVQALD